MAGRIEARLAELGHELPQPMAPAGTYVGWTRVGNIVHIAGQGPVRGTVIPLQGKVGQGVSLEEGREAAALTAFNLLAQAREACEGDLDRIVRWLKLFGLVNCGPDFGEHPEVINGASDLLVEVFGEAGRHARSAIGASDLPMGIPVEIDAVIEVR
ncbi:MAG: RidA family protein [Alphaproteobacteria bacterium]|jgi:enamine deaminase RidA (YjgF/YER057c/UK114 family)|nr:RidA family protein [Alphaproteobacteria bacterium]MDP7426954.1 RidA family protein [Alphaproteobacteria bacterium]